MLLPYLLKVSLLLAVLTLAYRWLIQYETFSKINRVLLWLNVAAAWTLPLIPLANWGPTEVQREFHQTLPEIAQAIPAVSQSISSQSLAHVLLPINVVPAWGAAEWLLLVYGLGVACMACLFLFRLSRLVVALWKRPAQRLGNGLILVQDEDTISPYSFFRWIILNPAQYALPETQQILAHETEHARQGHSFDLLLAEMQRIALWFNPLAWIHQQLVQGNLEFLADEAVLAHGFAKKHYQITLLHAVLRTNKPPLTNSFAQSLLKKRIKMMNRKPSHRLAWGKYALLLATLYVSAAFVAPYQKQIVEMTPAPLQPVVLALVPESAPLAKHAVQEMKVVKPEKAIVVEAPKVETNPADSVKDTESKWIVMKEDTLYWALASTAAWEDINLMKEIIRRVGVQMEVNQLKYDPSQSFITAFNLKMMTVGGGSGAAWDEEDEYSPIKGYSGYIIKGGRGMGQKPPEPLFSRLNQSYQDALILKKQNEAKYAEDKLRKQLYKKGISLATKSLHKEYLGRSAKESIERFGVGKSISDKLMVTEMYIGENFYLNGQSSSLAELNDLAFDKVHKVNIGEDYKTKKKYIMVYTN